MSRYLVPTGDQQLLKVFYVGSNQCASVLPAKEKWKSGRGLRLLKQGNQTRLFFV